MGRGQFSSMPLMKITGPGLLAIAVLTAALWGCLLLERVTVSHARANAYRALSEIRALQLKKHLAPAVSPVLRTHPARPATG
jgi:hypothetical protein